MVTGIDIEGFEFDNFDLTVDYIEDEFVYDDLKFELVIENKDFEILNEFLNTQGINSKLMIGDELLDSVKGISIDGFEFDDLDLAIEELEEEYGYEVEDWKMLLGHKSFDTLHDFLLEEGIYSELIF